MLSGLTVPTSLVENPDFFIPKKVLYVNRANKIPGAGASAIGNDPVIRMLIADEKFDVTHVEVLDDNSNMPATIDFDLVIAQETLDSKSTLLKPLGALAVGTINTPIIYNKSFSFQDGRAISSAAAAVTKVPEVSVTAVNTANPLFKGIDFSGGNDIRIFSEATANDDGSTGGSEAFAVVNNLEFNNPAAGAAATLTATPDASNAMVINYIPAGTQIGTAVTDVIQVNAVAFSFNYGAMVMGDGANISPEALTIWRNAAYWLTWGSSEIPTTLVANPDFTLSIDKVAASRVSTNVRAIGNRVYVSNVKSKTEINIYSISGALVKSIKTNENTNFEFKSGLWIATVKTFEGQKAVKFITN
ncbi:T9SS type A sorting domain-containing protein [Thalassobellus suaedae]|uniref:T9SS type A sorting domain-containing protein n=1 Tax=Thalassobellus suaedae TaxID=3074124 RepID=A0ABY9XW68_9FLAO|nr:T9SS type A sorting domain-containing protein [Flavobacteriaceae bacterium HL-DH14]